MDVSAALRVPLPGCWAPDSNCMCAVANRTTWRSSCPRQVPACEHSGRNAKHEH